MLELLFPGTFHYIEIVSTVVQLIFKIVYKMVRLPAGSCFGLGEPVITEFGITGKIGFWYNRIGYNKAGIGYNRNGYNRNGYNMKQELGITRK